MSSKLKLKDLFLHDKPADLLLLIDEREEDLYASKIDEVFDTNYPYILELLNKLHKASIIEFEKDGRKKIIKLTPKGDQILSDLKPFVDTLETYDNKNETT